MNRDTERPTYNTGLLFLIAIIITFFPFACSDAQTNNEQQSEEWVYFWEVGSDGDSYGLEPINLVKATDKALEFEVTWGKKEWSPRYRKTEIVFKAVRLDTSFDYYSGQRLIVSTYEDDERGSFIMVHPVTLKKHKQDCYIGESVYMPTGEKTFIKLFRKGAECETRSFYY